MSSFKCKILDCSLEYIPNDIIIRMIGYLVDSNDQVFINPNSLGIDTFTVDTYKSSLPTSGYEDFLILITAKAIGEKYNKTVSGYGTVNSKIISQIDSTEGLVPGLYITGSTNIPQDTKIVSLRDKNSIELDNSIIETGEITFSCNPNGWSVDYSDIEYITALINFSAI